MTRYSIGIDPGLHGGIALLDTDSQTLHAVATPVYEEKVRGKKKTQYDLPAMAKLVAIPPELVSMVYLELVSAMPGQGVTSMFRFGFGFGLWQGMLAAAKLPFKLVTPRVWKIKYELGSVKDISRERATEFFPTCSGMWKLKKHDGLAEAALLAHYAASEHNLVVKDVQPQPVLTPKQVLLG